MTIRIVSTIVFCFILTLTAPGAQAVVGFGGPGPLHDTASTDTSGVDTDTDEGVSFATDGAGTWLAAWRSKHDLGGIGSDFDIFFARSTDDGRTWSAAAVLNTNAAADGSGSDAGVVLVKGAGANDWVAVWTSKTDLGGIGIDDDIFYSLSGDDGLTWSPPATLNSDAATDDNAQALDGDVRVATNGAGAMVAVWKKQNLPSTETQVYYATSTDDGLNWNTATAIGGTMTSFIGNAQGTDVAYLGGASYLAAWSSTEDVGGAGTDSDILSAVITITGASTSSVGAVVAVNTNAATDTRQDQFPRLAVDGSDIVAAWQSNEDISGAGTDYDVAVATSSTGGASWSAPALPDAAFTSDTADDVAPALATDGAGLFTLVWTSSDPRKTTLKLKDDDDILVVSSTDAGASWSDPVPLAHNAQKDEGDDFQSSIATDGSTWLVGWTSDDSEDETIGNDDDILLVRSAEDCPSLPMMGCFESSLSKGSVKIKKKTGKDAVTWVVSKLPTVDKTTDLGDPTTSSDYILCTYVGGSLVGENDAPAGGTCFVDACWEDKGTSFAYSHKYGALTTVAVSAGAAPKPKVKVNGKFGYHAPSLPLGGALTMQLLNPDTGRCFSASFSSPSKNDAGLYKSKPD